MMGVFGCGSVAWALVSLTRALQCYCWEGTVQSGLFAVAAPAAAEVLEDSIPFIRNKTDYVDAAEIYCISSDYIDAAREYTVNHLIL